MKSPEALPLGPELLVSVRLSSDLPAATVLACAQAADEVGLDRLWLASNPYERSGLIAVAAVGARVTRIGLGVATVNVRTQVPAVLAEQAATASDYCPTGLAVGLGTGTRAHSDSLGIHWTSGLKLMETTVPLVRALGMGHAASAGESGAAEARLKIPPRAIPLLIGAVGPRMLALSGRIADGIIISMGATVPYIGSAVALAKDGYRRTGRAEGFDNVAYVTYGGRTLTEAARRRIQGTASSLACVITRAFRAPTKSSESSSGAGLGAYPSATALTVREDDTDEVSLWGEPRRCGEGLQRYQAVGVTEVALGIGTWLPDAAAAVREVGRIRDVWRNENMRTSRISI